VFPTGVDGVGHDNYAPRKHHEGQTVRQIKCRFGAIVAAQERRATRKPRRGNAAECRENCTAPKSVEEHQQRGM